MHLLLTRAAEDAERTRAKLEALGHRVAVSPAIDIVATGSGWPVGVVDAVIATSGQAFVVLDRDAGPSPEARRLLPLYLVGDRTALQAREHGFLGTRIVAPNAASLALALGKLPTWPARPVYLAGRDRKPDLETALDVIGRRPEVIEIYEAREVAALNDEARNLLRERVNVGVLHFSRRSARLFLRACEAAALEAQPLRHICLSDDVAGPLREVGCGDIDVAPEPNETALIERIARA